MIAFLVFCIIAILWSFMEIVYCLIKTTILDNYGKLIIIQLWDKWVAHENKNVHGFINTDQDRNRK